MRHRSKFSATFVSILFFFLFAISGISAQDSLFTQPVENENKPELREIFARLVGPGIVRGDFTQKKELIKISRTLESRGFFLISRDDGIVWETHKPFASVMVVDGLGITQRTSSGKTTRIDTGDNPVFVQFSETLRAVFSGDADMLFERFVVYFESSSDGAWRIGLVPKDSTVQTIIQKIELSGGDVLDRFVVMEPSGDILAYAFFNQQFSSNLRDDEKKFFDR